MTKKRSIIILIVFAILLLLGLVVVNTPIDLRPEAIASGISPAQYQKGKKLLAEMQEAYGGKEQWLAKKTGSYEQIAEWYGNSLIAGWDTVPQRFQMTSSLGTDNSEMTLVNGPNQGQRWGVEEGKSYHLSSLGEREFMPNDKYQHKLIYKNYWFQFPFRIDEAPIIAYAGEASVDGKAYDLLYVTWETEAPNAQYDQYVLYLDKETKQIEWLNFTVREKFKFAPFTAQFTDIKRVDDILCPFSQYVSLGSPTNRFKKLHENHYQWISFE
ncbi:MAG: hypothetical protein AAF927_25175 [Bacteroidota bacterium]